MNSTLEKISPLVLLLTRVITGYMFLQHGTAKFWEFPVSMTEGHGGVPLFSLFGIGGAIEIIGGLLLILGLFTRPAAFILAGQMAYAYFIIHVGGSGNLLLPMLNGGELAALYSMIFLLFVINGAGKFSLDAKLCTKQKN